MSYVAERREKMKILLWVDVLQCSLGGALGDKGTTGESLRISRRFGNRWCDQCFPEVFVTHGSKRNRFGDTE